MLSSTVFVASLLSFSCVNRNFNGAETTAAKGISGEVIWNQTEAKVFNPVIHRVELTLNQDVWNQLHEDERQNCKARDACRYGHVRLFKYDDATLENVAIKVRGNTSRTIPRLQFKVVFDKYKNVFSKRPGEAWHEIVYDDVTKKKIKSQTLHGLETLNLRRSKNDSSSGDDRAWGGSGILARETVATWAAAQVERVSRTTVRGAPVYRTAYTHVTFNLCANDQDEACSNKVKRMYIAAEDLDKTFFATRFDDDNPTFFSMSMGCAMKGQASFADKVNGKRCLEAERIDGKGFAEDDPAMVAKAGAFFDGPQGLKSRIDSANSAEELGRILDLDSFMNYAAVASTIGHWDSAFGNFNNDVLYFHKDSGKWKIIMWDFDNTFDYDLMGHPRRAWDYGDIGEDRLLFDKLFRFNEMAAKQRFVHYLEMIYDKGGNGPINDKMIEIRDLFVDKINNMLPQEERQDIANFQKEMFDFINERYHRLREQLH